jgi:hypothetical protein
VSNLLQEQEFSTTLPQALPKAVVHTQGPPQELRGIIIPSRLLYAARPRRHDSGAAQAGDLVTMGEGVLLLKGVEPRDSNRLGDLAGSDEVTNLVITTGSQEGGQLISAQGDTGLAQRTIDRSAVRLG